MTTIPQSVIEAAQAAEQKWAVPASVTIAQWALESAWGTHMPPGSNNPFGIKASPGDPYVTCYTREVINGHSVMEAQRFRKFATIADAFDDHGRLIATYPAYAHVMLLAGDPDAFARALTGVYATDPRYGETLVEIMGENDLYRWDVG